MQAYNLSTYQILTLSAVLMPSLIAIWTIFLQKDLSEKIGRFKRTLETYKKKKAEILLEEIQKISSEKEEKALKIISEYIEDWTYKSRAIDELLDEENKIYTIGKYIIMFLFLIFIFPGGLYTSANPTAILIDTYTRLEIYQYLFALTVFFIIYWFWRIFNFSQVLNKIIVLPDVDTSFEDIDKMISDLAEKLKSRERERK